MLKMFSQLRKEIFEIFFFLKIFCLFLKFLESFKSLKFFEIFWNFWNFLKFFEIFWKFWEFFQISDFFWHTKFPITYLIGNLNWMHCIQFIATNRLVTDDHRYKSTCHGRSLLQIDLSRTIIPTNGRVTDDHVMDVSRTKQKPATRRNGSILECR